MSTDKNAAQRRMPTVFVKVLGSPRRDLQLPSAEALFGMQHHLVKHVLRLVQAEFFISLVAEEML
jgi:hypothetical protein